MIIKNRFVLSCLMVCLTLLVISTSDAQQWSISGTAYDIDSKKIIYTEHYQLEVGEQGLPTKAQVQYRDPDGQEFANKTIDYHHNSVAPDIDFFDQRNQTSIVVSHQPRTIEIRSRHDNHVELQKVDYQPDENVVIDAGFNRFVLQHWDALLAGKKILFSFLSIDRAKLIDFSLEKISQNQQQLVLAIKPDSFFVGLMVDPIYLTYSIESKKLVIYQGLTNLQRSKDGTLQNGNFVARIEYVYHQQSSP